MNYDEVLESEEPVAQVTNVFGGGAKALHYMQAPGIYRNWPRLKPLQHNSVAGCTIPFLQKGIPASEMLRSVECNRVQYVLNVHPGSTNPVSNVVRLLLNEVVYGEELLENGRRQIMQPEQKHVVLIKDIGHKFLSLVAWYWTHLWGHFLQRRRFHCWTSKGGLLEVQGL